MQLKITRKERVNTMAKRDKLIKELTILSPGSYTFIVEKVLYVSSGEWNSDDTGSDIIFRTNSGQTIIMDEEELSEHNNIDSRYSVEAGMHIQKIVPKGNTAMFGLISQTCMD